MRALAPAWPPNARQSNTTTCRPSDAAYTAVARPGGTGAHDGDVESSLCSIESSIPRLRASASSEGLTQHRAVRTRDEHVGQRRAVLLEKRGGVAVLRGIDNLMRTGVAAQEILQSLQLWRFRPPDQHRAACAGFDQPDATEDQRTHNALAKIRLGDDESAQLRRRHQKGLDILLGMPVHQRVAAGKLRDLGRKIRRVRGAR